MSETTNEAPKKKAKVPPRPKLSALPTKGGAEARRTAAVILEVLAGGRTPSDAAAALGTSLPRYYAIEAKALGGLLAACEPTTPGKKRTAEAELSAVKKDLDRARREAARYQALVRASQRTIGITAPVVRPAQKGKRRKRPTVRALKAVQAIQSAPEMPSAAVPSTSGA